MYSTICPKIQLCGALTDGLDRIAESAVKAYGNGKKLAFADKAGAFHSEEKLAAVLGQMDCADQNVRIAAGVLAQGCPEDGVKTAVLMVNSLLREAHARGICEQALCDAIGPVVCYMQDYLARIDRETGKGLSGGGLYLINLARPLDYFANQHPEFADTARLMITVLAEPLKALAKSAKLDPSEVYERVKALAPNQFFSLNHFGLERSIDRETAHVDVFVYGLDMRDKRIKNLLDADVTVSLETACKMLDYVCEKVKNICNIADIL